MIRGKKKSSCMSIPGWSLVIGEEKSLILLMPPPYLFYVIPYQINLVLLVCIPTEHSLTFEV